LIRAIVFDIGWVFVKLNRQALLDCLTEHGCEPLDIEGFVARIRLDDHETGRMTGFDLIEQMTRLTSKPVAAELLRRHWLDIFELEPRMVALAHRLSARYRVYLLSNVGDLHWAHLWREYGLHKIGHGALPSFVTGYMKPDREIYREAERRFGLEPQSTVFIDDREENVDGARACGWQGILHTNFPTTVAALRALGVQP
jgi:HAD superfamily hydrolase (TIGR01509 family)